MYLNFWLLQDIHEQKISFDSKRMKHNKKSKCKHALFRILLIPLKLPDYKEQ